MVPKPRRWVVGTTIGGNFFPNLLMQLQFPIATRSPSPFARFVKTRYQVGTPHNPKVSAYDRQKTPPKTLRRFGPISRLNNRQDRTKAQVPPVSFSRKYGEFTMNSLFPRGDSPYLPRKESVKPGVEVDMGQRKYCNPEDMVQFLLALCCQDDSSTVPISRDEILDKRFGDCLREVIPIADSKELTGRLNA